MGQSLPKSPPADGTVDELQDWLARQQRRAGQRARNGRETGLDRQLDEQRQVIMEAMVAQAQVTGPRLLTAAGQRELLNKNTLDEMAARNPALRALLDQNDGTNITREPS